VQTARLCASDPISLIAAEILGMLASRHHRRLAKALIQEVCQRALSKKLVILQVLINFALH
jgi:hypothetical protein